MRQDETRGYNESVDPSEECGMCQFRYPFYSKVSLKCANELSCDLTGVPLLPAKSERQIVHEVKHAFFVPGYIQYAYKRNRPEYDSLLQCSSYRLG